VPLAGAAIIAPVKWVERIALPASPEPGFSEPWPPRRGRIESQGNTLLRFCSVCGVWGSYGSGVNLRGGRWGGGSAPLTAPNEGKRRELTWRAAPSNHFVLVRSRVLRMTEPVNPKMETHKRTNAEGSAQEAEGTPTPQQREVLERYLKLCDSRPRAPRLSVKSRPSRPVEVSQLSAADIAGLELAFGTTEAAVANLLLNSLITAACDGTSSNPPTE
jgi:hypothetical protein